jgi:7,8-dihydropterin-6-yl-methyl-4-(beta-D-ribofuranosyl)aminobenzene 5'-phosphate synthase
MAVGPALRPVERLIVQVLVDNVTDSLSSRPPDVMNERQVLARAGMKVVAGENLCSAHHGLALVLTARAAGRERTLLFDGGPDGYAVRRNGTRLGVDFAAIEAAVLSHGHYDHSQGLRTAFEMIAEAKGAGGTPVYLHPGMFRPRGSLLRDGQVQPMQDVPSPEEFEGHGARPVVTAEPQALLDETFYVSGEIPRVTPYERGLAGHVQLTADGRWQPDPLIVDERFVAVNVRDKGRVVFSACSHAGIVNVLRHAAASFPDVPLYGVVGGFHLVGSNEAIIGETVADMRALGLRLIVPGHCTGWRAVHALADAFGEPAVVPMAVGSRHTI